MTQPYDTNPRIETAPSLVAALYLGALLLAGCSGGEDMSNGGTGIVVKSAAAIAQESADDYNANVNGLITGATLKRWKDDWVNQRPAGITGKLVIFQLTAGPTGSEHIKPNGLSVFTYHAVSSEWIQTRSNGVILTQSMVPDGRTMDALLKKYDIDPQRDMIVCAMGTGSYPNAMGQGRCWYALRYWGVEAKNLAILNGGNQWLNGNGMTAADFQAAPSVPPNNGTATVKDLPADNTALQATVEDMLAILPPSDTNVRNDGVFLWDARSIGQYSAGETLEAADAGFVACGTPNCAPPAGYNYMSSFQNNGSRQGHPWGAVQLNFGNMLDAAQGYSYKPKAALASYLNGDVDAAGKGFVDGSYQLLGAGNAYQPGDTIYAFCETTFRAMITGITAGVILGKPTRFYDGAIVEWNSLSYLQDATGNFILPVDSPWRTDLKSFFRPAVSPNVVGQRAVTDAYAVSANAIIREDKQYKTQAASGSASGSGGGLPANPCGG